MGESVDAGADLCAGRGEPEQEVEGAKRNRSKGGSSGGGAEMRGLEQASQLAEFRRGALGRGRREEPIRVLCDRMFSIERFHPVLQGPVDAGLGEEGGAVDAAAGPRARFRKDLLFPLSPPFPGPLLRFLLQLDSGLKDPLQARDAIRVPARQRRQVPSRFVGAAERAPEEEVVSRGRQRFSEGEFFRKRVFFSALGAEAVAALSQSLEALKTEYVPTFQLQHFLKSFFGKEREGGEKMSTLLFLFLVLPLCVRSLLSHALTVTGPLQ